MKIIVYRTDEGYRLDLPRNDGMVIMFNIPIYEFRRLLNGIEDGLLAPGFLYPIGNSEEVLNFETSYGVKPSWEFAGNMVATPLGLVVELIDGINHRRARSMPIPWAVFERLSAQPSEEVELKV